MITTNKKTLCMTFLLMACLFAAAGPVSAATYNLRAGTVNITMPDGTVIPAWGFATCNSTFTSCAPATVPGPQLDVLAPDTSLTINLTNNLAVPVSINIPGQRYPTGATPTYVPVSGSNRRVQSFTNEAPAIVGTTTITFNNLRPGTYLYESGTNPAMEIPMGLYGALVVRPTATVSPAYGNNPPYNVDSAFDNESVMLLSEIDPAFNIYVNTNNTTVDADPAKKINYSISYAPKYFLINGKAYPQTTEISAPHGQRTLLRLINAGTRNTVPTIQGNMLTVIAEDGNLLNYSRHEFSPSLNAGKTLDVITAPTTTGYNAFYDRRLGTSNAGVYPGGILTFIGDLNCSPLRGDVNGDGRISAIDALTVLRAYVAGTALPTGDVSLDPASGLPCGNGAIDLFDVLLLLQKATGFNPY